MPIIQSGGVTYPPWCELYDYSVVEVRGRHAWASAFPSRRIVGVDGSVSIGDGSEPVVRGASRELSSEDVIELEGEGTVVLLEGAWGSDCGGSGLFGVRPEDAPDQRGDRWDYPKNTDFDRHFHDSDEYWIVVAGSATVVTEGESFEVHAGDCVATRMGDHHDVAVVEESMAGVFFETTMRGQRRKGHLWAHTHGEPVVRR